MVLELFLKIYDWLESSSKGQSSDQSIKWPSAGAKQQKNRKVFMMIFIAGNERMDEVGGRGGGEYW